MNGISKQKLPITILTMILVVVFSFSFLVGSSLITGNNVAHASISEDTDPDDDDGEGEEEDDSFENENYGSGSAVVTLSVGQHGTVKINGSSSSPQTLNAGEEYTLVITPDSGYEIDNVKIINGGSLFENLTSAVGGLSESITRPIRFPAGNNSLNVTFEEADEDLIPEGTPQTHKISITLDTSRSLLDSGTIYHDETGKMYYCTDADLHGPGHAGSYKVKYKANAAHQKAFDYIMYYGYPRHKKIGGKKYSARNAHDLTQIAIWMILDSSYRSSSNPKMNAPARALANKAKEYDGKNKKINGTALAYFPNTKKGKKQPFVTTNDGSKLYLKKRASGNAITDNSNYTLDNTVFKIFSKLSDANSNSNAIATLAVDEGETEEVELTPGTYYVKETHASPGYKLDDDPVKVTLKSGSKTLTAKNEPIMIPVGVRINLKGSTLKNENTLAPGKEPHNFAAKFKVEYWDTVEKYKPSGNPESDDDLIDDPENCGSPKASFTVETAEDGSAVFDASHIEYTDSGSRNYLEKYLNGGGLPLGYYRITEIKAPVGFKLDSTPAAFIFYDSNRYDQVNRPVCYQKFNNARGAWDNEPVVIGGCDEITKSSCNEHLIKQESTFVDEPYPIGIIAEKRDNDTFKVTAQGDVPSFAGIKFEVINNGPDIDTSWDLNGNKSIPHALKHGAVAYRGVSDANGVFSVPKCLPVASSIYGGSEYIIRETESINGYHLNSSWNIKVRRYQEEYSDSKQGEIIDTRTNTDRVTGTNKGTIENSVWRGGIELQKWDHYLDKSEAINGKDHDAGYGSKHDGTDLNNIKFTVINRSVHEVVVPKDIDASIMGSTAPKDIEYSVKPGGYQDSRLKTVAPGEEVGVITTSWDSSRKAYIARTQKDALPYGTYEIKETRTNKYYQLTDTASRIVQVRENGKVYEYTKEGNPLVWKDKPWRQNIKIKKVMDSSNEAGAFIPFKITSKTTGEYHYFVTDTNGEYDSEDTHSRNMNGYDEYIDDCINNGSEIDSKELESMRVSEDGVDVTVPGLWFGKGEDGSIQNADDDLAALPYGTYELEEIECSGNKGRNMIKRDFTVGNAENKIMLNNEKPVNLGTITNKTVEIKTTAKSDATDTQEAPLTKETSVTDTVSYKGLTEGKQYTMKGSLMKKVKNGDAVSGVPLLDKEGKPITAEKKFTAAGGGSGTIKLTFVFDSSLLSGVTTVVFEDLYEDGIFVASHADIEDRDQTIWFPEIKTTAKDKESRSHNLTRSKKAGIVDEVSYKALTPGKEYRLEGTLMKVTGSGNKVKTEPMKDADGKEIKESKSFIPGSSDGKESVEFTFNAKDIEGGRTVVFESVLHNGNTVARHADPLDEGQTIWIPEIKTTATDKNSGLHLLTKNKKAVIVDEVSYKALTPGKEYRLEGTLMKVTGSGSKMKTEPMKDAEGKKIKASRTFKPASSDGIVTLEFSFSGKGLASAKTVVFESLISSGTEVADHKDPEDEGQTINIAGIKTKANLGSKNKVKDVIKYENLIPGKKYTMTGWLVDKKTKKMIEGTKTSKAFTPSRSSGKVTMTIDAKKAKGEVVVFEECYLRGNLVGEHKDIKDKHQTVKIKGRGSIQVKNSNQNGKGSFVKTGDAMKLWIFAVMAVAAIVMAAALRRGKGRKQ